MLGPYYKCTLSYIQKSYFILFYLILSYFILFYLILSYDVLLPPPPLLPTFVNLSIILFLEVNAISVIPFTFPIYELFFICFNYFCQSLYDLI